MIKIINYSILLYSVCLVQFGLTKKVNAFTVELFKSTTPIESLSDADALIGGTNLESTSSGSYDIIDFRDVAYGTPWGHSDIDNFFPGTTGNPNINNYAVLVTTTIEITSADDWTFLTSGDDGVRLRIDGFDVIKDDALHPTQDNLGTINLAVGEYDLELVLFENFGVGSLELWAAQETQTTYNSNFQLVGDVANGGIAEVPFDFSPSLGIVLCFGFWGLNQFYKNSK
ncbi:hypothetical protein I4641_16165 [Waterburya agarophytonicola K14]|uniref:PA14 domain-containing protein n=1 Tax=Waterburya agarophytonicola KI4 TaxID=2874699 RepID=A0A964FGV7_9CYAN|nr:PA14 domain-containing protein [Waterburya agarophytonicola]MCC0178511.1 hypothetical protein [Waterburya agarophytonicola KI4]